MVTFWASFVEIWATFYSAIWLHCLREYQTNEEQNIGEVLQQKVKLLRSGFSTGSRAVSTDTWVRIQPTAIFIVNLFTVNCFEQTKINIKRLEMAHF